MKNIISNLYSDYLRYTDKFRALPWEVDMLKPVERRVLLSVHDEARTKFVKAAKVIGTAIGRYHPHGDLAVHDVLVGLVQNGLVEGQGNWGNDNAKYWIKAAAPRYVECKAIKFLDDGFSEFLEFAPWENFEYEDEPHFLPFYLPIGLIGEGLIQGISLHTTKIPRYDFIDLLTRLYELITESPTKTTIIPKIRNNTLYEDKEGEFERILTTGVGVLYSIPKYKVTNSEIILYGKNPISGFTRLDTFNEKYEETNNKSYMTVIDNSSSILEVIVKPKKGSIDKQFTSEVMDLVSSKIHVLCNVISQAGVVETKGIDSILLNTFNNWKILYLKKLNSDLSKLMIKYEELNIILEIRLIIKNNPTIKTVNEICSYNKSTYSNEQITSVCSKYRIKTLIEANIDLTEVQKLINSTQNEINNIDQFALNRIKELLKL